MSNLPLGEDLKQLFDDVTSGRGEDPPVRAILVQNENGVLKLVETAKEEGTDKEDFSPLMGKLFAKEPTRPGYALFRLDSKSPAGLYEWINCAFRPEGARVRDKMQYAVTQASLFRGLSEQHFLETVYGSTASEFSFPSKLRNARKHDYQNPQKSTRGRSAAEAAGTDAGGATRNFDVVDAAAKAQQSPAGSSIRNAASVEPVKAVESKAESTQAATDVFSQPASKDDLNDDKTKVHVSDLPSETSVPLQETEEEEAQVETPVKVESPLQEQEGPQAGDALNGETRVSEEAEQIESSLVTSHQPAKVASTADVPLNDAVLPEKVPALATAEAPRKADADKTEASPAAAANNNSSGVGRGAEGLQTEKERQLAALKADEAQSRSSASGAGGPRTGFSWHSDVAPALQSLAKKDANLVVLRVDLSKEEVQLAQQPSSVEPDGLADALTSSQGDRDNEPSYVLYAHPQALDEGADTNVGVIYVCPLSCTVRQRMLYSTNMVKLCKGIDSTDGLKLLKRAETSDPAELTADELSQILLLQADLSDHTASTQATFSRPKRPGRK